MCIGASAGFETRQCYTQSYHTNLEAKNDMSSIVEAIIMCIEVTGDMVLFEMAETK